ncbi:MAG: hypothetical protein JWQ66_1637 [Mucilaginibacter sp.]|nr:hypothetical protein [Mucilaginibacter sp.]
MNFPHAISGVVVKSVTTKAWAAQFRNNTFYFILQEEIFLPK